MERTPPRAAEWGLANGNQKSAQPPLTGDLTNFVEDRPQCERRVNK